jgi:hypothetical protein
MIQKLIQKWNNLWATQTRKSNWVTIFQSTDEYSVRIHKMKLEANQIPVSIFDQRDSSYNAFGYLYLNVRVQDEKIALELIEETNE